jgi:hypothetical protein
MIIALQLFLFMSLAVIERTLFFLFIIAVFLAIKERPYQMRKDENHLFDVIIIEIQKERTRICSYVAEAQM